MAGDGYTTEELEAGQSAMDADMEFLRLESLARKHQQLPEMIEDEFRSLRSEVSDARASIDEIAVHTADTAREMRDLHVSLLGNKPWQGLDGHLPTIKGLLWAIFITLLFIAFR